MTYPTEGKLCENFRFQSALDVTACSAARLTFSSGWSGVKLGGRGSGGCKKLARTK